VAVEGGCGCIVKDCLIGDPDVEYGFENGSSFSGRDRERHIERQNKAEYIFRVMDFTEINSGFIRR